jgi:D-beta-D-heptose 7-phosphate kinase/D-beta-D-heptose 1-phosphate adenosyltransferase
MSEQQLLLDFLAKDAESAVKINIIGDSMFDEYHNVDVKRISPEFPIPVYKSNSFDPASGIIPGGAANVAAQLKYFNVNVQLISLITNLAKVVYEGNDINTSYSKVVENMQIPTKKRIYSEGIPLVRWDIEKDNFGLDDIKKHLIELEIPDSDFNIFSDYSKGIFSCPWFRKYFSKAPSLVDPKNSEIDMWQDCTYFKPNSIEARYLSERKNWKDQIEYFINSIRCKSVVITQGGNGIVGKDDDYFEYNPKELCVNPESLVGAGDCFAAFLSMAICRGFKLEEAAKIAYTAGSLYVKRNFNKPISPAELLIHAGIKLVTEPQILKNRNFKLVATNGCFDLVHAGHLQTLKYSKKQGERLVVLINSDESVAKLKGDSRPILPIENRIKMIQSLDMVDFVVVFNEETPELALRKIMPDVLVKGVEYENKEVVGSSFIKEIKLAPMVSGISTTDIIKKIKNS